MRDMMKIFNEIQVPKKYKLVWVIMNDGYKDLLSWQEVIEQGLEPWVLTEEQAKAYSIKIERLV